MSALIAAARREGSLNVIALPPGLANYGAVIREFSRRYGITVHSIAPGDSSAQEIAQIKSQNGAAAAADVLDLSMPVALAHASLFAPYQVATWTSIPAGQKAPDGAWVQDYGGYMSVGYDRARFGVITSLNQLLGPRFRDAVALAGDPRRASAALNAVMMASLASGGSPGDIAPGVSFFHKLKAAGNLVSSPGGGGSFGAPAAPVVINWDFLNTPALVGRPATSWKLFIPAQAVVANFSAQAINARAPHPAVARLWEEFLYSQGPRGGQNMWARSGLRPVEEAAMAASGTLTRAAVAQLPPVRGTAVFLSRSDQARAAAYLAAHWAAAVG